MGGQWGVVGGWVGKVSKAKNEKKKLGAGREEKKVPKTKQKRVQGKKYLEEDGEKIKLQKKTRIRAEKG